MQQILVIRGGALGDGLLTVPALAALRTRWPQANLTLIGPRTLLPFAAASGLTDTAHAIEDEAGLALMADQGPRPPWSTADLGVVWLQRWQDVARRLEGWGCRRVVAGPSLPLETESGHVADHLFRVLAPIDIGRCRLAGPLAVPPPGVEAAEDWRRGHFASSRSTIALHPGSGGQRKCWPTNAYRTLAQRLLNAGRGVLVCLGPAEADIIAEWQQLVAEQPHAAVVTHADLVTLAGLVRQCAGFIGNDAGVTHLAAALGVPTVAIFGPTDPARWAPLGRWVRVLRDPAWLSTAGRTKSGAWQLRPSDVERACADLIAAVTGGADTEL